MVARSKELPVSARLGLPDLTARRDDLNFDERLEELSVAHSLLFKASRLRELHVQGRREDVEFYLLRISDEPAPLLRSLVIQAQKAHFTINIPKYILSIQKPQLQFLTLDYCQVLWPTRNKRPLFSNLLHLNILRPRPRPPREMLLDILRASPDLLALRLESTIPLDLAPLDPKSHSTISLACPQFYMVTDTNTLSTNLYTHISHPQTTETYVYVPEFARPVDDISMI
ncbi:hypothetical protein BDV98DRAFT_594325 [Pterulicium gracile]|uniref:F-box domain-containing protein n=1 Tax=Pterulicium gracile TaxID=1884261 RepID=A0A5C3QIU8_9AGAR|nr:hypothetical protein BDV98DRAFT_594325 [Pterula gracilis]